MGPVGLRVLAFLSIVWEAYCIRNSWSTNGTVVMTQKKDGDKIDNSSRLTFDVTTDYLQGSMNQFERVVNFVNVSNTQDLSLSVTITPPLTNASVVKQLNTSWRLPVNMTVNVTDPVNNSTSSIVILVPPEPNYSEFNVNVVHSKFAFFFYLFYDKANHTLKEYYTADVSRSGNQKIVFNSWRVTGELHRACLGNNRLIHIMESTQAEVLFFCAAKVTGTADDMVRLSFYECSSVVCMQELFNSSIETPRLKQEIITREFGAISDMHTLRSVRLEVDPTVFNDTVFWKHESFDLFHMDEVSGEIAKHKLAYVIRNVQVLKSQFLMITVDNPQLKFKDKIMNYLFPYPAAGPRRLTRLMSMVARCIQKLEPQDCRMGKIPRKFLNFYYLGAENENIFEFDSAKEIGDTIMIDVYRFQHALGKVEKIVEGWPEKQNVTTTRYTGVPYFIQLETKSVKKALRSDRQMYLDVYLSPRRYKALTRFVESIPCDYDLDSRGIFFLFDPNFKIVYLIHPVQSWAIPIEPATLRLEIQGGFRPENTTSPVQPTALPSWISDEMKANCQKFTLVDIPSDGKIFQQLVCLNVELSPGTCIYNPSRSNPWKLKTLTGPDSKTTLHIVSEKVPVGIIKEIDFKDLLIGSFLKLVPNNSNTISETTNNYLDSYYYKLQFKKAKFLESIYGFESYDGDERKITFAISTTYENYFYLANRFQRDLTQPAIAAKRVKSFSLRDYRVLTRFEPINASAVLVQVEDLTYVVNINTNTDSPDFPSKGANGVCSNNTILKHNTMGKLMLCVYETKVYIRILNSDFGIVQISTTADVENILKSIRHLKFLRSSAHFENFVFLWYHTKPDTTSSVDSKDDLNMAILILDNVAKPTLSLVQLERDYRRIRYRTEEASRVPLIQVQDVALAGDKLVALEKIDGSNPETYFATYSFGYLLKPAYEYTVQIPTDHLMILATSQMYITNVMSELESEDFLNSVVTYQKNLFQVTIKVQMIRTKEIKALVFNPFALPYDSLSFIELPQGFTIVDIGPTTHLTKKKEYVSLCILGANTTKLDDAFFSQEPPVYIFLVNDLTPTLTLKPIKDPQILIESTDKIDLSTLNFTFNMTSSIFSNMFLEKNRYTTKPIAFDLTPKTFVMEGSTWGKGFAARGAAAVDNVTKQTTVVTDILLNSSRFATPMQLEYFYFRLDPAIFIKGTVLRFSGRPESSVEAYMGIVAVLPNHNTTNVVRGTSKRLIDSGYVEAGRYFMSWDCNRSLINQETHNHQTPSRQVWACRDDQASLPLSDFHSRIMPIVSFNSRIYRVHSTSNVSDFSYVFPKNSNSFFVSSGYVFYLSGSQPNPQVGADKSVWFCVDRMRDTISDLAVIKPPPCSVYKNTNEFLSGDSLELIVFKASKGSVAVIREYNTNLLIYTQLSYYKVEMGETSSSSSIDLIGSPEFISSDHLSTVILERNSNWLAFNIYSRWRKENNFVLIIACSNLYDETVGKRKFAIPLLLVDESMDTLYSISHDISIYGPRPMSHAEKYVLPGNKSEECLPVIVSFNRGNSYLIYVPLALIENHMKNKTSEVAALGGVQIDLNQVYIAPISNPFFGFTPDSDSPEPQFYSDYFFKAVNFKERSYLLSYHLKTDQLKKFADIQNILGLKAKQTNADLLDMDSVYETQADYIYTTSVIALKERPIAMMVMPNVFPRNDLEHQMIYVSQQHELFEMNFTSYMNVRVRTFRLASRMMTLNVSGVLNQNISVQLNFKGFANSGFLDDVSVTARLIVLTVIALAATAVLLLVIEKDVNSTQGENHRVLLRHSIKPITSAIGNFASVMVPHQDQSEEPKRKFEESDDSDEATEICASLIKRETAYIRQREASKKKASEKGIRTDGRSQTQLAAPTDTGDSSLTGALTSDAIRSRRSLRPGA